MHISYFKRPLFILFVIYCVCILLFQKTSTPSKNDFELIQPDAHIEGCLTSPLRFKKDYSSVILKVTKLNGQKTDAYTYARFGAGFDADMRECLELTGTIKEPYGLEIDGSFNWKKYLADKNVFSQMYVTEAKVIKKAPLFFRALNAVRNSILKTFKDNFDEESVSVISGIALGEKTDLTPEVQKYFNDSGVMHLLVASGSNVGFVTLIIYGLCALLGVKTRARLPLALVFAGIYTLLAGADAPLLRAYIMTLSAGLGLILKRNSGAFQGLLIAGFVILIFAPKSLFEVSFQMSFLATCILVFSFSSIPLPEKTPRILAFAIRVFLTTLAVQLVLVPIYTNVFYRFSLTAFISNIFLVPLAEFIMFGAFALYFISFIKISILFKALWAVMWVLLELFKFLVHFFGGFSFSAITVPALGALSIILYYVSLFLVYGVKKKYLVFCLIALFISPFVSMLFRRDFVYILNNNRQNAVVVKDKELVVFTDNFDVETLKRFILSKGYLNADILYGTQEGVAKKMYVPFKDFWPGEEINSVKTSWGIMKGKNGLWTNTGYSGTRLDSVSYLYDGITIGGRADFILKNDITYNSERNKSISVYD